MMCTSKTPANALVQTSSSLISLEHFTSTIEKYIHARLKAEHILWSNGVGIAWAAWDEHPLEMIESQI